MPIEVLMPQMGQSVAEGTVLTWLKREGERVGKDEPLLAINTDKVDVEIPSPGAGVLGRLPSPPPRAGGRCRRRRRSPLRLA